MFLNNKKVKRAVRDWIHLNFRGVRGHGIDAFIGKVVDIRTAEKRRLEKEGRPYSKVFANVYSGVSLDIEAVVGSMQGKVACREGCSYCCKSEKICVSIEEIYMISMVIFNDLSGDEAENVARLVETVARLATSKDTKNIYNEGRGAPCVFLKNDTCSIYAQRPMACRSYLSLDNAPCESRLRDGGLGQKVAVVSQPLKPRALEIAFWEVVRPNAIKYEINAVFRYIVSNRKLFEKLVKEELGDEDLTEYLKHEGGAIPITVVVN
jgi:Fe-S-cluster containining protein